MAASRDPMTKIFTEMSSWMDYRELITVLRRTGLLTSTSIVTDEQTATLFTGLSTQERMTVLNDMTPYLSLMQLGAVITHNCPDPDPEEGSPMPAHIYGSDAQIEVIQYIRGSITNDTWDFVEDADERVAGAGLGPPLFNLIVAIYKKWSRHWKVENPEHSPESSSASSRASSRASSHEPRSSASSRASSRDHIRPSTTPSPRARPGPHGGAYRDVPHRASHSPQPQSHIPGRSPRSRSPGTARDQRPGSARSTRSELPDLLHQMKMACISE
jgi:hypothetical protein